MQAAKQMEQPLAICLLWVFELENYYSRSFEVELVAGSSSWHEIDFAAQVSSGED